MSPRRDFGLTWWGQAWIEALEQRARLDPNRLPRGRTYARHNRVLSISADPGEVTALVSGSQRQPYRVRLRVREFTEVEWDKVLDAIASRAGHAAALLDGELLPEILDDVAQAGVDLLPGPGELGPRCSCPDWADPCKHAAAVCYLVALMLDEDPFQLFHLRGRGRDRVLADVRARRRALRGGEAGDEGGAPSGPVRADERTRSNVIAREAFARPITTLDHLRALDVRPALEQAGVPMPLLVSPPADSGVRAHDLTCLAADAAERAFGLVTGTGDSGLGLMPEEDLARWAAKALGTPALAELARRSQVPGRRLVRLAVAWQHGGREGVAVSEGVASGAPLAPAPSVASRTASRSRSGSRSGSGSGFDPDGLDGDGMDSQGAVSPSSLAGAREALATIAGGADRPSPRVQGNRVTAGRVQLRWAPSGRWYRFVKVRGQWEPDGPPSFDPADLVGPDDA